MKHSAILLTTILSSLLLIKEVSGTANCLYCKRSDVSATFLVSYAFCESSDVCLQDRWNYINRPCTSKWKRGSKMLMDDCTPKRTTCHPFVSSSSSAGNWFNFTETLGANEYCAIEVDSSSFVGRMVIDDAITVGAEYRARANDTFNTTL